MARVYLVAIALGIWAPSVSGAQVSAADSARARIVKVARDSIYCTTSSVNGPRCTRARQRLDSLRLALLCPRPLARGTTANTYYCPAVTPTPTPSPTIASIDVIHGPIHDPRYASGVTFCSSSGVFPPGPNRTTFCNTTVDTVTVCGVIMNTDDSKVVGWRPVRLTLIGDSATAVERSGNALSAMCGSQTVGAGVVVPDSLVAPRIAWTLQWLNVDGFRILRPVFHRP